MLALLVDAVLKVLDTPVNTGAGVVDTFIELPLEDPIVDCGDELDISIEPLMLLPLLALIIGPPGLMLMLDPVWVADADAPLGP